ncbi:hypothetical protein XA68_18134 [Ophiocordyceps unilateralis]|uniref:NACHT domain-containing protein n=1 Tax=Ophiocordyceps unilateralis TaxID=268505 RepID=A0A2A9PJQ7_OPHUN|nr:hypothetical protein XA68_18134 [Ophiocordyceps unilateralis]
MASVNIGYLILLAVGTAFFYLRLRRGLPRPPITIPARQESAPSAEPRRGVRLCQVPATNSSEAETDVDIIAIHGLDTKSPDTWIWKDKKNIIPPVNWLSDSHMLPSRVGPARIFTCDWPADLFEPCGLTPKTNQEFARRLLDGIKRRPPPADGRTCEDRPILFIASCLGGIVLMKALVMANNEYSCVRTATRGVVFLATPFGGTSFQGVAKWAEPGLKAWASLRRQEVSKLLDSVKQSVDIDELVRGFTQLCRDPTGPQVMTFYELGETNIYHKVFPSLPVGSKPLVDKSSATLQIVPNPLPLDRCHQLMNKFCGDQGDAKDDDYPVVVGKVEEFLQNIRKKDADDWIRDNHYTLERLKIERLSGEPLPMDQCYINLAIVKQWEDSMNSSDTSQSSPFSLFARQKVVTPDKTVQIDLAKLFNEREGRNGHQIKPRRILIRGRAGVGKTTLCKKMVYDFTYGTQTELHRSWNESFDRLLWVPLRHLKGRPTSGYSYEDLFYHEYFWDFDDGRRLAGELWRTLRNDASGRTLFILDGLDEVSQDIVGAGNDMSRFFQHLLDQPNVIITSRPNASLPTLRPLDLELETIGFYPDQVTEYINKTCDSSKAERIKLVLQQHWLIKGLVRIPIQLDALCYAWDEFNTGIVPRTMTDIYKAIEKRLWKKDVVRLGKKHDGEPITPYQIGLFDVEDLVDNEISLLEGVAFTGLHNNMIDFTPQNLAIISKQFKDKSILLDKTLPHLSFLRTSDPFSEEGKRDYHFLHLTYQEYYAARYFVREWISEQPLKCLDLNDRRTYKMLPVEFLHQQKYTARYDVFWRFVTGLLAAEDEGDARDEGRTLSFLRTIEQGPLDLLGPTHQRLLMRCLSEASANIPVSSKECLERSLKQWLLFECTLTPEDSSWRLLSSEMEFPDAVLSDTMKEISDGAKIKILRSLHDRLETLPSVNRLVVSWLRDDDISRQFIASVLQVYHYHGAGLSSDTLTAVVQRLDDDHSGVRTGVIRVLQVQPDLSDEALTAVIQRLGDEDVRGYALAMLADQPNLSDEVLTAVIQRLGDGNSEVREGALFILKAQNLSDLALTAVIQRLGDDDWRVRQGAMSVLRAQPNLSDEALTAVIQRLGDDNEYTLTAVIQRLGDDDEDVRHSALAVLVHQPNLSDEALTVVIQRLGDDDWLVRMGAMKVLRRLSSLSDQAFAAVIQRLDDNDEGMLRTAREFLSQWPTSTDSFLAAVIQRLRDSDGCIREAALHFLRKGPGLPNEFLITVGQMLSNDDSAIRSAAIDFLSIQANEVPLVISQLMEIWDRGWLTDLNFLYLLEIQPSLSEEILTVVVRMLDDDNKQPYLKVVLNVLQKQPSLSDEILTIIVRMLDDDEDSYLRIKALEVLRKQPSLSDEILTVVVRMLDDDKGDRLLLKTVLGLLMHQSELSEEILTAAAQLLESERAGHLAEAVLRKHERFYSTLLVGSSAGSLLKTLSRLAFGEQVSWYIQNGRSCINMPDGIRTFGIDDEEELMNLLNEARLPDAPPVAAGL